MHGQKVIVLRQGLSRITKGGEQTSESGTSGFSACAAAIKLPLRNACDAAFMMRHTAISFGSRAGDCRWVLAWMMGVAGISAPGDEPEPVPLAGNGASAETSDEEEDPSGIHLFGDTRLSLEADLEYVYEKQGLVRADEFTFDEVSLLIDGGWGEAALGASYKRTSRSKTAVEESWIRLGGVETFPWFVQGGRSELPFGVHASEFNEDPMVTVLGEIERGAIQAGYASDRLEVTVAGFDTKIDGKDDIGWVAAVVASPREGLELGLSWTSHLGESLELRELYSERQSDALQDEQEEGAPEEDGEDEEDDEIEEEDAPVVVAVPQAVRGMTASVELDLEWLRVYAEYVTALESFEPGVLDDRPLRPSAWVLETGWRPIEDWEFAARYGQSDELPDNPSDQYGAAVIVTLTEWATLTVEAVRGDFQDGEPDRTIYGIRVGFEY